MDSNTTQSNDEKLDLPTQNETKPSIPDLWGKASNTISAKAEALYSSADNTIRDTLETSMASVAKVCVSIVGTIQAFAYAGIAITAIIAPVPTAVGIAVLWLMGLSIDAAKSNIDTELNESKKKREYERAVHLLKKHGILPSTATVETKLAKLEIKAESGVVDGFVKTGHFSRKKLSELEIEDVQLLIGNCPDPETKELLAAYISYKIKASTP